MPHARSSRKAVTWSRRKRGALCRCKIWSEIHFSHRILSPLAFCLPLELPKILRAIFQIFKRSKGRQNGRGDKIRCEKWIRHRILHRHSAPLFSLTPTYQFSTPRVWHLWDQKSRILVSLKKWTAIWSILLISSQLNEGLFLCQNIQVQSIDC